MRQSEALGDNNLMARPRGEKRPDISRSIRMPAELWKYLRLTAALREPPLPAASELVREILEDYAKKNPLPKGLRHK
jgi:hypothetical protein